MGVEVDSEVEPSGDDVVGLCLETGIAFSSEKVPFPKIQTRNYPA
jgi:hypothetical protein